LYVGIITDQKGRGEPSSFKGDISGGFAIEFLSVKHQWRQGRYV
jgi:hypothetical protein